MNYFIEILNGFKTLSLKSKAPIVILILTGIFLSYMMIQNMQHRAFIFEPSDKASYIEISESIRDLEPISVVKIAKLFIDTPYLSNTLDGSKLETLTLNLQGLDCTTYIENVLAFALLSDVKAPSFSNFTSKIKSIRYRDSRIIDSSSRLHYFTDWLYENEKNGHIKNITKNIGGVRTLRKVNFMTKHFEKYTFLENSPKQLNKMLDIESNINERDNYFIPQDKIESISNNIQSGDIIAITTNIKGLDIVHVGFAYQMKDGLHFLHASSKNKKVLISKEKLSEMITNTSFQTGIMVARVLKGNLAGGF